MKPHLFPSHPDLRGAFIGSIGTAGDFYVWHVPFWTPEEHLEIAVWASGDMNAMMRCYSRTNELLLQDNRYHLMLGYIKRYPFRSATMRTQTKKFRDIPRGSHK